MSVGSEDENEAFLHALGTALSEAGGMVAGGKREDTSEASGQKDDRHGGSGGRCAPQLKESRPIVPLV